MQKIFFLFLAITGSAMMIPYEMQIINGLQMQMFELKTNFESRISALETRLETKEQEIKTLTAQQTDLIENAKTKYQVLDEVKELAESTSTKTTNQVEKQSQTENELHVLRNWNGRIERTVSGIRSAVHGLSEVNANKPYFKANRDGSAYIDPANNIAPFENVLEQNGEGYNPQTGTFTAKIDGVYLFSYTVGDAYGSAYSTHLKHNGDTVCYSRYSSKTNNGCTAVMTLKAGDTVYVTIDTMITGGSRNSFTGVQLWVTNENQLLETTVSPR